MLDTERVRMKRLKLRLSQQKLGELIGQDQAYISRLERGVITDITIATLERLADALQTSADYLLGRGADDTELLAAAVA
ncbi:MAG TPA: helix-turn-helix transcriptional regulator [Candidatus Tectomicrobia bacterium]